MGQVTGDARLRAVPDRAGPSPGVPGGEARPTGRVRHDEKITVYLSAGELHELDLARLTLGRDHAVKVDRGRIVREAVAVVLADLEDHGDDSVLVRRLRQV